MKIAVLGGGHGGYAAAADLTLRGYEVCLFTFSAARVETLRNNDNVISYTGVWGEGSCRVAHVSNSMEEAVSGADLVVMNVPGTGHERYLNAMKPYLRGDTVLYMNPGHTGGAARGAHSGPGPHRRGEHAQLYRPQNERDERACEQQR